MPAITRSKNMKTPARTSVTPARSRAKRGRRRADAHDRAGQPGGPQRVRGRDRRGPLLLRERRERVRPTTP